MRRRASESSRPPEHNDPDLDISLVKADSLDSLSSGGDSDGGPEEPTAAEISLLSASIGEKKTKYIESVAAENLFYKQRSNTETSQPLKNFDSRC